MNCPGCGKRNEEGARFCNACGHPLTTTSPQAPTRKLTTLVFSDVKGSTEIGERLDPEAVREVMDRYFQTAKEIHERHGGTVEKFIGDAVMAAYGIPTLREDDALRAVRAAVELRDAIAELNTELTTAYGTGLEVRTGVNTGEVIAGDPGAGQAFVSGDPVNVAARLEAAAPPGEILIGEPTHRLVRDAVKATATEPLDLKGKSEAVPAYLLEAVKTEQPSGVSRRFDLPLIGREDQLLELEDAFERAIAGSHCELVTVYAEAGTGKSRLAQGLSERLGERATTIEARCSSYLDAGSLWPLKRAFEREAGVGPEDERDLAAEKLRALAPEARSEIGPLLGAFGLIERPSEAAETQRATRAVFEALAKRRPVLFIVDDLHWAAEPLLDLLRYLRRRTTEPLLVCSLARGELTETHPDWAEQEGTSEITLAPLGQAAIRRLIKSFLESEPPAGLAELVTTHASGNPLFAVEILESLLDRELLRRKDGGWEADPGLTTIELPATVETLLAARIEALSSEERAVVEAGSVCGEVFWDGAIRAIEPDLTETDACLHSLSDKGLVEADRSAFEGERAFRFAHGLIREAAYRSLAKRRRADYHERIADWLDSRTADRAGDSDQLIGTHLESAYRYRAELGTVDEETRELGRRAGVLLGAAGEEGLFDGEMRTTMELLNRGLELLPEGDPARIRLLSALSWPTCQIFGPERALEVARDAAKVAAASGDRGYELLALLKIAQLEYDTDPGSNEYGGSTLRESAQNALRQLVSTEDGIGTLQASIQLSNLDQLAMRWDAAAAHLDRLKGSTAWAYSTANALWFGPTPVDEAISQLESLAAEDIGSRLLAVIAVEGLAPLEAMRGNFDRARELFGSALDEFDDPQYVASVIGFAGGPIEIMAGDLSAAEPKLRSAIDDLRRLGSLGMLSSSLPDLARVFVTQDRIDEAEAAVDEARELTAGSDLMSKIRWRTVKARVLAGRGEFGQAERLATEAIGLVEQTDAITEHATALLDLAHVHDAAGHSEQAVTAGERALELYRAKGHLVGVGWAQEFLGVGA